jgi:hypothetical protein
MRRYLFLAVFLLLTINAIAQEHDPIVGLTERGDNSIYPMAISRGGNLYDYFPRTAYGPREWAYMGNIWEMAGMEPSGSFCGVASFTQGLLTLTAITQDGKAFCVDATSNLDEWVWIYDGNIGEIAGVPQDGLFVAFFKGAVPWAMTESGQLYRRGQQAAGEGVWEFIGSIEADTGVVPSKKTSAGSLKTMFR